MTIQTACAEALGLTEHYFRQAEACIPPAKWVPWQDGFNWRFVEQTHQQMLVQKLARQITGLKSFDLLLQYGFLQEVGVILRTLDEIGEDISFISLGLNTGRWDEKHDRYAKYFWSEDEDDKVPPSSESRSVVLCTDVSISPIPLPAKARDGKFTRLIPTIFMPDQRQ